jgi:hypothetical protein
LKCGLKKIVKYSIEIISENKREKFHVIFNLFKTFKTRLMLVLYSTDLIGRDPMKIAIRFLLIGMFILIAVCPLWAANSDNHDLTVTIAAINELNVSGNLTITIDTATAGQEPNPETDATSTIDYTTNSATNKKITGQYAIQSGNDDHLIIKADITSTSGTTMGPLTLADTTAVDLVTGLQQCADAGETLTYECTATVEQGVGNHVFRVTYTLTDQ